MSGLGPRNMGHGLTVSQTRFADGTVAPPTSPDPIFYRKGLQLFLRDTLGTEHPVAVGADGLGVVSLTVAQSPYEVQPTDRVLLIDTTDGPVTAKLPADGGPFLGRSLTLIDAKRTLGTNSATLDGNGKNIGAASTLVLSTDDASSTVYWADPTWEVSAGAGSASPPAPHADTHKAGGSDDLLSAPGEIGGTTPAALNATRLSLSLAAPSPEANRVIVHTASTGKLTQLHGSGGQLIEHLASVSATAIVQRTVDCFDLGVGATRDIAVAAGGFGTLAAVTGTASSGGQFTFAGNGSCSFNGLTFTDLANSDTPGKLCVFSGGPQLLRVKNNLGSSQKIVIAIVDGLSV